MRFRFGELQLDDQEFTLVGPDGPIHVEPQVFDLLRLLIVNRDRVVSKEELLDTIWGDRFVSESALTSRVKAARRAVGDDGRAQAIIKTAHGRGYQFVAGVDLDGERAERSMPRLRNAPIGRDHDIAGVIERVRETALTTITGPGGIGKTTLALAVGERLRSEYADGVVFADLVPVPPGSEVAGAVAEAAGLEGAASESVGRVATHLANRPVLLVLDNCEHVLDRVAALVDQMLDRTVTAHILATSREPLGVPGEHVWPLGPLGGEGPALFVERARAAEPRVEWDASDPAVTQLCERLDNVPLALELAAGQLRRFDLDELTQRLDDQLELLSGPTAPDGRRHASMETAIDWSYRLLDPIEQSLLRHLSVFPGWFDVGAVEAVAPPEAASAAVSVFGQLVDKSLVVRRPGSRRYRMLETIRVFAGDRLEESGEATAAFERHRLHVRDRVASASRLDRWFSARLAAAFRTDLDDARQAFRRSLEAGATKDAVEIALGASFLWRNAMGCAEGNRWVDELLALDLDPHDELWVQILHADVGQGRGDHRQMFGAAAAAADAVDRSDDAGGACIAAHYGALAHLVAPEGAKERFDEALALAHRSGDARLVTLIGNFRAVADLAVGNRDESRAALAALEQTASEDGYDAFILHWSGWLLALAERDAVTARRWISMQHDYLDRTGIVETWITSFSTSFCDASEGLDIRDRLAHTLALADREGYEADADCLLVLAYVEMGEGRFEVAAELVGSAMHGRFNATAHYVLYRAVLDRSLREHLAPAELDAALARGRERGAAVALARYEIALPAVG